MPGFWAPDDQTEIPYAEEPPAPLETAPAMPPPDENSTYVPGYWLYRDATFVWRPGFYTPQRAGRIWIAPRYLWTAGAGGHFVGDYVGATFAGGRFVPVFALASKPSARGQLREYMLAASLP